MEDPSEEFSPLTTKKSGKSVSKSTKNRHKSVDFSCSKGHVDLDNIQQKLVDIFVDLVT